MSLPNSKPLTSFPVFTDRLPTTGPRTVVCFGLPRGGTSMVAGAILGLGVPMGLDIGRNLEDPDFSLDKHPGSLTEFTDTARRVISERNAVHPIWGWKFPNAARYLEQLIDDLRAPHLVCVYRDPVPIALRRKRDDEAATDFAAARLRAQIRNTELIEALGVPSLMVSYEKASAQPIDFISELANFLNRSVPPHVDHLVDFMRPGAYKNPEILQALLTATE